MKIYNFNFVIFNLHPINKIILKWAIFGFDKDFNLKGKNLIQLLKVAIFLMDKMCLTWSVQKKWGMHEQIALFYNALKQVNSEIAEPSDFLIQH